MVTKRFIVKVINNEETSDQGDLEFKPPLINVTSIKLKSVKLCNSFYNISADLGNNTIAFTAVSGSGPSSRRTDTIINILDGIYNLMDIEKTLNDSIKKKSGDIGDVQLKFKHDNLNNHVTISKQVKKDSPVTLFYISGKFLKLLGFENAMVIVPQTSDYGMKINPIVNYYIHCDLIDKRMNYFNSKESDVICILPLDQTKRWWSMLNYSSLDCTFKPSKYVINSMKLWITDVENNRIHLNGYPVIYELEIIEDENTKMQESNFSCNINDGHFEDISETVSIEPNYESISCC